MTTKWAVCLNNTGYEIDLEPLKLYQVINDQDAKESGCIRVVDGSGEDYLYAADRFMLLELAAPVEEQLQKLAA
jgi:hypothetical protein